MDKAKILIIDDDPTMLDLASYRLRSQGYEVKTAQTGEAALRLCAEELHEVALTDLHLPDIHGMELVKRLKEVAPATEIIMITGYSSVTDAIEAIKAGAFYFVEKPVEFENLFALIEKALERGRQNEEIRQLRGRLRALDSYYNIIGSSKPMQKIYEIIDGVAESDANIMITGESGTGKELVANAIHYRSLRSRKPFVKINCSALPKELIESELFGHTKGAFTGAATEKTGLIARATGGSLMLDEIGEMPIELQPKLLRVLQERVYYRVGSEKANEADFRLISATNRDPLDAVRSGQLREDLYYRINTIEIHVPPLRERAEDVQHLAEHFLRFYAEKYQRPVHAISHEAYEHLFAYNWPGNVRELQNVIERAVLLCKGDTIEVDALISRQPTMKAAAVSEGAPVTYSIPNPVATSATAAVLPLHTSPAAQSMPSPLTPPVKLEDLAQVIVNQLPEKTNGKMREDLLAQLEGELVKAALKRTRGNKQAASKLLGVYRPRLYSLLKKHSLKDAPREPTYSEEA
ncbi:MAG TPA: sigma-54 dependent transcriptional regulator [Blastocatellia bacterium]|nr:sigma-54 dependent transcriptional regulator [Blastocatellia bacterium]